MGLIQVGFDNNVLPQHPLTTPSFLSNQTKILNPSFQTIPLIQFLENGGVRNDNRQRETFIVKKNDVICEMSLEEIQEITSSNDFQILGVKTIGNKYQKVTATVQGHDPKNPQSGFERPIVEEGPHMVICVFAYDQEGKLRIFRTLQMRNNRMYVDTIRGFAEITMLETGEVLYDLQNAEATIYQNIVKVIKNEGGKKFLDIKKITFLGPPIPNSTFVQSQSAMFAVEVDYNTFRINQCVADAEEINRRKNQFNHEGLTEYVLDLSVAEYIGYKLNSEIVHDMTADWVSDTVLQYYFTQTLLKSI
jgi:hypothetical protein